MSNDKFFVTGALGCIGAWIVRNLVHEGTTTTVFDLSTDVHRLQLIMDEDEIQQVEYIAGDVTDLDAIEAALRTRGATHLLHLAALQVPACRANPPLGARVNVVGTTNVFEAAQRAGLQRVVYASSAAVYGPPEEYPAGPLPHTAPLKPRTHYGVYKQANEGIARMYWQESRLTSIGLRPYVVYGPGRDQGLTSSPTKAMLAAALGQSYHIPFGGRFHMQFADDVAKTFIQAARAPFEGADAYNLGGSVVHMRDVIKAIETAVPAMQGKLSYDDAALPFPEEMDSTPLERQLSDLQHTSLVEGVAATVNVFAQAIEKGHLSSTTLS